MKKVRIGVVGLGWAGQSIHIPKLMTTPEVSLVGVTDLLKTKTDRISSSYGIKSFSNYIKLCESSDIDAVFILTPPSERLKVSKIAFENGKDVFCEKPMALNLAEGKQMVEQANKSDVKLMIGYDMRYSPEIEYSRKMISLLGENIKTETFFLHWLPKEKATFQYSRNLGGGALFEMGTHHIDLLRWFFGEGKPFDIKMKMVDDVDVMTSFSLRFPQGVKTRSNISYISRRFENSLYIKGDRGYLKIDFHAEKVVERFIYFKLDNIMQSIGELAIRLLDSKDPFQREIDHFVDCVLNDKTPLTSGLEALKNLELINKIYSVSEKND